MKNFLFGASIIITLLSSCSTNINVDAAYKPVTVVYGLLDPNDSVQYIRIEKGFIDKSKSAVTLAQNPDSIYYGNILKVQLVSSNTNTTINLNYTTNVPKNSGAFANSVNVLYQTNQPLDPTQNYTLNITNTTTGQVITSQTSIVNTFPITTPTQDTALPNTLDLAGLNSQGTPKQVDVAWASGTNGVVYTIDILFYYQEWPISNKSAVTDTFVDWQVVSNLTTPNLSTASGQPMNYNITGNDFYYFLSSVIPVDATKQRAPLGSGPIVFKFSAGGLSLYDYLLVSQSSTSLAAIQALPNYTDITNGIGIFSSRTTVTVPNVGLNQNSLDSLACGSITSKLNFVIQGTPCYQ